MCVAECRLCPTRTPSFFWPKLTSANRIQQWTASFVQYNVIDCSSKKSDKGILQANLLKIVYLNCRSRKTCNQAAVVLSSNSANGSYSGLPDSSVCGRAEVPEELRVTNPIIAGGSTHQLFQRMPTMSHLVFKPASMDYDTLWSEACWPPGSQESALSFRPKRSSV